MLQTNQTLTHKASVNTKQHPQFICPYCASPLTPNAKTWRCDGSQTDKNTQHPFDVARQGYVNLLPVHNKKSKDPGDSPASIDARHRFLNQGFYQPLQQKVAALMGVKNNPSSKHWLDIGCGEGYYTQSITQAHPNSPNSTDNLDALIALDISKPAIALFAKTAKQHQQLWTQIGLTKNQNNEKTVNEKTVNEKTVAVYPIVASAAQLPLAANSVGGISSIFSPILPVEFARVLPQEGRLIIAKPDTGHLQSVRDALFDEVRPHDSAKFLEELAPYFTLIATHQVQANMALNQAALADLLTMTPYSYRAKLDKREALIALAETDNFKTQARFVVYELVRV